MTRLPDGRFESPVLVGRAAQLETLNRSLDWVRGGRGRVLTISGEAGIGKSRLVSEARSKAKLQGFMWLQGNCYEPDRVLPYSPILELIRSYLAPRPAEDWMQYLPGAPHELIRLLPELGAHFHDISSAPPLEPPQERRRLFQALADIFIKLARLQPLLLVIEDIHWADETSVDFLLYLARRISDDPLLILLTYRTEEALSGLEHFLAELDREPYSGEFKLGHLSRDEVYQMIRALLVPERQVRAEFLDALYGMTEGNPFFVEEVLKALVAEGEIEGVWVGPDNKPRVELHIPRSVRDAVRRRTERLTPAAARVLDYAAVAGREFNFDLLQAVSGSTEAELLEVMKELRLASLVVEKTADEFAFRHALTREAVYATLMLRERKSYHRSIAKTMERIYSDELESHIADIAYHFYEAGAWEETFEYSRRAGEKAQSLNAPREAIELLTRTLEAASHLGLPPPLAVPRARAQAYETVGDFERARADDELVLDLARRAGDGVIEWRSLIDLGALWASQDYARAGDYFRSALDCARALEDSDRVAHTLNRVGNWQVNTGDTKAGLASHREALEIFSKEQNQPGMAETYDLMGMGSNLAGDIPGAIEATERAVNLFRELGDLRGLAQTLSMRYSLRSMDETGYSARMSLEDLERYAGEGLALAREIGWTAGQAFAEFVTGSTFAMFGEFGKALAHAAEAIRIATEIEHQQWICGAHTHLGQIYVQMLQSSLAVDALQTSRPLAFKLGSSWWIGYNTAYLALAYLLKGDRHRAEQVLEEVVPSGHDPKDLPERRMAWVWSETLLAGGDYDRALRIADNLIECVPSPYGASKETHSRQDPIPTLLRIKGRALTGLRRYDEAEKVLKDAQRGAIERGARPLVWQILVAQGKLHQRLKRREESERCFEAAREVVRTLALTIDEPGLREGFLRAAFETLPSVTRGSPERAAKREYGNLTARERQVAALVAAGNSNPEIAAALVLSERTVTTHVSNILSKLGYTSRAQIAAWAAQKKLV